MFWLRAMNDCTEYTKALQSFNNIGHFLKFLATGWLVTMEVEVVPMAGEPTSIGNGYTAAVTLDSG